MMRILASKVLRSVVILFRFNVSYPYHSTLCPQNAQCLTSCNWSKRNVSSKFFQRRRGYENLLQKLYNFVYHAISMLMHYLGKLEVPSLIKMTMTLCS